MNQILFRNNSFGVQEVSSPVRTLQSQSGLDYVLAATDTEVAVNMHIMPINLMPFFRFLDFP